MAMCVMTLIAVAGCATSGEKGVDESAAINATLGKWKAAVEGQKTDDILAQYSESFQNADFGDKAGFKRQMEDFNSQGAFQGSKVNLDKSKIVFDAADKMKAAAGPVDLQAQFGGATLNFTLKKEADGMWRFIGMTVDQY